MGLKFRRGTTAQKSGSLAFGEPYVNTDLGTLQIGGQTGDITLGASGTGSQGSFAGISGSSLDITGNAKIDGNLTLGGAITIGDASADTVNVIASLSSSLIPQTSNAFDLGSATKIWRDLYISTGSIKFVEGNTVVKSLSAATLTALETSTGSSNISITSINSFTSSIDTTIKTKMNTDGIISGSSQIAYASINSIPAGIVSGSSQVTPLLPTGVVSGSSQTITNLPAGTVSGSSQISLGSASGNIALATQTTGNYVASLVAGTNITLSNNSGEGATPTIGLTNNSTTIGTTAISLGSSSTTLAGLTSVTSTAFVGALTGNASTATTAAALTTARTINGTSFDGSANITILNLVSGSAQIDGAQLGANKTITIGSTTFTLGETRTTIAGLTSVTSTGFTGALTGNASTATTAAALTNARTINGTSFDGSANITIPNLVSGSAQVTLSSTTGGTTSSNVQFNSLGIGMAASATAGRIDATNDVVAFSSSDIRFKENIVPIENALDKISKISGNTYDWKAENKIEHGYEGNDVGVIAQEIEAVLPQLVQTRENGFKAVKYDKLVALLIEGIKEQQTQIEKLRMDLDNYECKCDNCKSK